MLPGGSRQPLIDSMAGRRAGQAAPKAPPAGSASASCWATLAFLKVQLQLLVVREHQVSSDLAFATMEQTRANPGCLPRLDINITVAYRGSLRTVESSPADNRKETLRAWLLRKSVIPADDLYEHVPHAVRGEEFRRGFACSVSRDGVAAAPRQDTLADSLHSFKGGLLRFLDRVIQLAKLIAEGTLGYIVQPRKVSRTVSEANLGGLLNMERRIRLAESLQSEEKGSDNGGVRIE